MARMTCEFFSEALTKHTTMTVILPDKPKLYHACGTEDFLFDQNVRFNELTDTLSLDIETTFDLEVHEWSYWNQQIKKVINWLPIQ